MKLKGEWIFTIIKSLEARLVYSIDEGLEEEKVCEEALKFFRWLSFEVHQEEVKPAR